MQAGGNAHAEQFFRQHGCTTNDAKMKYNSRAATLYKDKLHGLASAAMRKYGTQLHIDFHGHNHEPTSPEHKEVDFFDEHLGAKKGGLGAQKVKKDFKSIEKQALEQDKLKAEMDAQVKKEESKETPMVQSMRLAYQDMNMSKNMKQQEEKLKASDPRKAKQAERLGMGIAGTRSGVSHSVQEMKVIDQVTPVSSSRKERDRDDFDSFDDFASSYTSGPPKTSRRKEPVGMSYSETDAAQTKFANAKSISSDQFFGREKPEFEVQQRLDRFSGNQSISSADLFGEDRPRQSSRSAADMAGPDLSQLKEGVKSTAARMATLVNGVVNTIQDKYGS
uniref:Uncharacterized protein n=1 Tax=Branchiostoma floridae TaxID=7739 RepID=C3ZCC0_BRAFL|eukprot:XP_002593881.1 hypothetical protein BRAFLDRAFT_58300 [Branchiostoma floridae]